MYALIDCNNFFVSCERLFRPDLWKKPTAVLSNNDGCIVARSQEVKDLGIPMGIPLFKVRDIVERHSIEIISSNFSLYGDLSNRVMSILEDFTPDVEIYSIDEAFLNFGELSDRRDKARLVPTELGDRIIQRIRKDVGLPISVGIAPTKTLTKVANELGKIERRFNDVTDLSELTEKQLDKKLSKVPVGDIWGIGYNRTNFLKANEIYTALDFKRANQMFIRKNMSVMGERTYLELNGVSCFKVNSNPTPNKGISSTRSFGKSVKDIKELEEAISSYVGIATRKLREQKSTATHVTVYLRTNKHKDKANYFSTATTVPLDLPTDYTPDITEKALRGLKQIFKPGFLYKKAGIYLTGIRPKGSLQYDLFSDPKENKREKKDSINTEFDRINKKYGSGTLTFAAEGIKKKWNIKSESRSPRYTTRWDEILTVAI